MGLFDKEDGRSFLKFLVTLAIPFSHRQINILHVTHITVHHINERLSVTQANIAPHYRIARCDTRKIVKPPCSVAKNVLNIFNTR